jgi:alpha-L-rhamnosidase
MGYLRETDMSITHRTLCAFALILLTVSPAHVQERRFDISQLGAVGDGATTNTAAIQAVIDEAAQIGGGTVVVPAGTFLTGALFFKPGVNLHLNEGGVLKGTTNMMDYKLVQTRWEGEERIWVSALINVFGGDGFHLSGTGTLDGSGDV